MADDAVHSGGLPEAGGGVGDGRRRSAVATGAAALIACVAGAGVPFGWAQSSPYTGGGVGAVASQQPRAVSSWKIAVTKDGASVGSGYCGLAVFAAGGGEACDQYVLCEDPGTSNFICSSGPIACSAAASDGDLAGDLAAGLNAGCAGAVTASASGNVVTVTAAASNAESCVFSTEMGSVSGFALGLNVGVVGAQTCTVHNVCDGTASNEFGSAPVAGGFSFHGAVAVPALSAGGLSVLAVLIVAAAFRAWGRGHASSPS